MTLATRYFNTVSGYLNSGARYFDRYDNAPAEQYAEATLRTVLTLATLGFICFICLVNFKVLVLAHVEAAIMLFLLAIYCNLMGTRWIAIYTALAAFAFFLVAITQY
jgi:hypothetical protein